MSITAEVANLKQQEGYIIVCFLPETAQKIVSEIQKRLASLVPKNSLVCPEPEQLHITFAHVVSGDDAARYDIPRQQLFEQARDKVDVVLRSIAEKTDQFNVVLDEIEVFPAAIILKGKDPGAVQSMRDEFVAAVPLHEQTRRPPAIVHMTLARFAQPIDILPLEQFAKAISVSVTLPITELSLVHEQKIFMQKHELVKTYPLR